MLNPIELKKSYFSFLTLNRTYRYLFIAFFLVLTIISVLRAAGKEDNSDFYVFWLAGQNFFQLNDLYFLDYQVRQFLYPPFAAALFGLLALFKFKVAAIIFSFFNMVLWISCVVLCTHIIEYFTKIKTSPLIVFLALIFSLNFYISNLNLLQVNLVVFFFTLLFIYHYLRGNYFFAALFIATAISFKVTPIIFLGWIFFRGNLKCFFYTIVALAFFTSGTILLRGFDLGLLDLKQFVLTITQEIPQINLTKEGYTNNKSLRGMLTNFMIQLPFLNYTLKSQIISISSIFMGVVYICWLFILILKKKKISLYEFTGTFIVILLTSEVTRTAHMVTLLFPLLTFLSVVYSSLNIIKFFFTTMVCLMLIISVGKDFDHILLERINILGISMLIGLIASMNMSMNKTTAKKKLENV